MDILITRTKKKPLVDTPELCCWTYEVRRKDRMKWQSGHTVALGFDAEIPIEKPRPSSDCDDYEINPKRGGLRDATMVNIGDQDAHAKYVGYTVPAESDVLIISFVAPCAADTRATISFHEVVRLESGAGVFKQRKLEPDSTTIGPASASRVLPGADALALLARFEGLKLGVLLGKPGLDARAETVADGTVVAGRPCNCAG
jgi:hypothetical protein